SDQWALPAFQGLPIVDLVGKTDLIQLVALFNQCDLVVSHDCGPMHLATLAGTRVVALFGPTDPHWLVELDRTKTRVLWGGEELACRPCYDGRNFADCANNLCMKSISVEAVDRAAHELLAV